MNPFCHSRSRCTFSLPRHVAASFALSTFLGGLSFAQAAEPRTPTSAEVARAAATNANASSTNDPTVVLSPFEVRAEEDSGYLATSTLAGTRIRSELKDLAASITVITKDFMTDINATDATSLLVYTLGTEVAGFGGNFSGISDAAAGGVFDDALLQASPATRSRGLIGADATRNYFLSDIPMNGYNIERVEISRGANAILFGLGSPAGIVNSQIIRADLRKTKTNVSGSFGSYGTYRGTLDHNQVLLKDKLSLRFDTVFDNTRFRIKDAFSKTKAITLTGTYQPFKSTTLRVTSEFGRNDSNRPESRPPFDRFTWWWLAGKPVWNPVNQVGRLLGTPTAPFTSTSIIAANGTRVGTPVSYLTANWGGATTNEPLIFYTNPNSSQLGGITAGSAGTVDGVKMFADNAYLNPAGTALQAGGFVGLNSWFSVEQNIYQSANPLRALYGKDLMISDPNVMDFYHQMLSGPGKYEYNWYESHNVTLEQTFFERRAGLELSFNRDRIDFGGISPSNYSLNLDINEVLPNGAPNPNFLRPLSLGGAFSRRYGKDKDAARLTGYYNLDLRKVGGPRWLGKFLGVHNLNGNYSRQNSLYEMMGGTMWNAGLDWNPSNGQGIGGISSTARIVAVGHYLGDSVQNTAGPADAAIQVPTVGQNAMGIPTMRILTNNRPAATTPSLLQPWVSQTFGLITNSRFDVSRSVRNAAGYAERTEQQVRSSSLALQSHWLESSIVTTLGWRRDQAWSFDSGIPSSVTNGVANVNWDVWYPKLIRTVEATSHNYGIVGHLPRFLRERLPLGTEASGFYNYATNFRVAPQRFSITREALPSETGETKEYGIRLSMFNGKLDFKVAHYETVADKASVSGFVGAIGQLAMVAAQVVDHNFAGDNAGNPAGIAAFESWLAGPYGQIYNKAFSYTYVPNPTATATEGKFADANGDRGQIAGVSALKSTGYEFELTFNPTRNWRISGNAASQEAVRTKIAPEFYDFLFNPNGGLLSLISNPDGTVSNAGRLIGTPTSGGNGTLSSFVIGNVINNGVSTTFAQEGTKTDELRKWRFNLVTNYSFNNEIFGGRLKGFGVGGALRWQDRQLLGYAGKTIVSGGTTLVVSDITKPILSPTETNCDLWFSYRRKLSHGINWTAQLNIRNVGVGNKLRPLSAWPDGTIVNWTIRDAQRWTLSNSFSF